MIHLHVHTDGSQLDGAASVKALVAKAVEYNMSALGITDHGNMINTLTFQEECIKNNIKPIIGCEFYVGEENTDDKFHLILLAKNQTGLSNLYKLNTVAYMKNFKGKPRITWNMLLCCHEGLICTTACLGSSFCDDFKKGYYTIIKTRLVAYKEMFGDDFYIEIQPNAIPMQRLYNHFMVQKAHELGIKLVAACDIHYVNQTDYMAHDTLLCMQTKKKKEDQDRFRFSCNDFYMKTASFVCRELYEMGIQSRDVDAAVNNTHEISHKCNALIETDQQLLPRMLGITDEDKALRDICNIGFIKRQTEGHFDGMDIQEVIKRIYYELSVIKTKGYSGYFLIEEDFLKEAECRGIYVGKGRGSACGSEVAFICGITGIEPIKNGLLFERFLNPERNSPPDIDRICRLA